MRRDRRTSVEADGAADESLDSDAAGRRLDCRIEDGEDGPTATLFPVDATADDIVTRWLTADEDAFVSLADWR